MEISTVLMGSGRVEFSTREHSRKVHRSRQTVRVFPPWSVPRSGRTVFEGVVGRWVMGVGVVPLDGSVMSGEVGFTQITTIEDYHSYSRERPYGCILLCCPEVCDMLVV